MTGSDVHPPFAMFVGVPRSGTTLVLSLFDAHRSMVVPLLPEVIVPLHDAVASGRVRTDREGWLVAALMASSSGRASLARLRDLGVDVDAAPGASVADALRGLYADVARASGKPRYGDKTPAHVLHLPLLARLFPEARFVHVLRDGRDVAASMLRSPTMPDALVQAAVHWTDWVGAGRRDGSALGPARYREVRYEELVRDPEPVLRSVCEFLDLGYDPGMLDFAAGADARLADAQVPDLHRRVRQPLVVGARDWRRELSRAEVARFELIAGDRLTELGYELAGGRPPAVTAAGLRLVAGTARLRNRLRLGAWLRERGILPSVTS